MHRSFRPLSPPRTDGMRIRALMVDVDGVLVTGRPADGRHWQAGLAADLGIDADALHGALFAPFWDDIVTGRADLLAHLAPALAAVAPHVTPADFVAYWFGHDARLEAGLLDELAAARAAGLEVWLATNQEHHRARYLMETLGLAAHVDGMLSSAALGVRKPHARFFLQAQRTVGHPPHTLLLVDDARANVDAARAAGWHALHWAPPTPLDMLRRAWA